MADPKYNREQSVRINDDVQVVEPALPPYAYEYDNEPMPLFTEMLSYDTTQQRWLEFARWVKFEEKVEEGSGRWSKPHVSTTGLLSLLQLSAVVSEGQLVLDSTKTKLPDIFAQLIDKFIDAGSLEEDNRENVLDMLLRPKQHQFELTKEVGGVISSAFLRPASTAKTFRVPKRLHDSSNEPAIGSTQNKRFLARLPRESVAANILVGEAYFLEKHLFGFIRLKNATYLPELTEVELPSKIIFVLLGPSGHQKHYQEIGRALATMIADKAFGSIPQTCETLDELVRGMDRFLDDTTVLPPGSWNPEIRIQPPSDLSKEAEVHAHGTDPALQRTGKLFGGLIADVKRKLPHYLSDFKDGLNAQCLASFFFMYFATLAPIITFGGLYEEATGQRLAVIENIMSAFFCGVTYYLFCGQPLNMLGATGPVLVCETLLYNLCRGLGLEYLPVRFWVNVWIFIFLMIVVMTDASAIIKYITRFTEESFAVLIAIIFIVEAFKKLKIIYENDKQYSLYDSGGYQDVSNMTCYCKPHPEASQEWFMRLVHRNHWSQEWLDAQPWYSRVSANDTSIIYDQTYENFTAHIDLLKIDREALEHDPSIRLVNLDYTMVPPDQCHLLHGDLEGTACFVSHNIFFMSLVLTVGTFVLATWLKKLRHTYYLPRRLRMLLSDFAITWAVAIMIGVDFFFAIKTDKLYVPTEIRPTLSSRTTFLVDPTEVPLWVIPFSILPGLFMAILVFMDQQITTVIVNRAENKLRKGAGFHLDLFVLSFQVLVCGIFGMPVFVAATTQAMNHVSSLKIDSEARVPGEVPQFKGCVEQRVTGILTFFFIGLTVFLGPLLVHIPLAVLYGVFLYMGVNALTDGLQFFDRILLIFMPTKYQPDYAYLRHVKIGRVHLFTLIQIGMFGVLLLIKSIKAIALAFPLMLVVIVIVRYLLQFVFTKHELNHLDDELPEVNLRRKEDQKQKERAASFNRSVSVSAMVTGGTHLDLTDFVSKDKPVRHAMPWSSKEPEEQEGLLQRRETTDSVDPGLRLKSGS